MNFLLGLNDVLEMINNGLKGLTAWISEFLYTGIAGLYELFMDMGSMLYVDKFSDIYNKISLIIGVFMVFRTIFWLIEILINPDYMTDKEKAPINIIKKILVSVIMLAITPTLFKYAYDIQYEVVTSNLIAQVISPSGIEVTSAKKAGRLMAANLFNNFYSMNDEEGIDTSTSEYTTCSEYAGKDGYYYRHLSGAANDDPNAGKLVNLAGNLCLTYKQNISTSTGTIKANIVNFDGLMAVGVGVFVFWMILMYCISIGSRYIQLIFLQIIAPIPIMAYLTPKKDNMFSKWIKQCTTTYLDLFIRIAIINFSITLITMILGENSIVSEISSSANNSLIQIFLVLGLLTFAKKAPDLIQELLPKSVTKASGDFGLSWKKRTDAMVGGKFIYDKTKRAPGFIAGGTAGLLVGGAMGAAGGKGFGSRLAGLASGAARGFNTGSKKGNIFKNLGEVRKNQAAQNSKLEQWRIAANKGEEEPNTLGDYLARKADANKKAMGFETKSQALERKTKIANEAADSQKNVLEYGKGKSKEKNTRLKAFGKDIGIAEMEAKSKQAATAYQNNSVEKLLSTTEGETTLRMGARKIYENNLKQQMMKNGKTESDALAWIQSNSSIVDSNFTADYNKKTGKEKEKLAEEVMNNLQKEAFEAQKEFTDYEKQAAFTFLVGDKDAQNVKNDFATITEFLKSDKNFANDVCADYVKRKHGLVPGTPQYDSYTVDSSEINDEFIEEMFNLDELDKLKTRAENNDTQAMSEFEGVFKAFDMFKTLKARYVAENNTPEALRDKANDKYNTSK